MADDITIKVGFDGKAAQAGLAGLGKSAQQAGQTAAQGLTKPVATGLDQMKDKAEKWGAGLIKRFLGIGIIIGYFTSGINEAIQKLDEMAKLSSEAKKAGLGVEDYQRLKNVSEATGTSVDELAKAFDSITESVSAAKNGNLEAIESLKKLGFTQDEVKNGQISSTEVLFRISQRYKQATTDAQRLAVATDLLGDKGSKLKGILGMGTVEQQMALNTVSTSAVDADAQNARQALDKQLDSKGGFFNNLSEIITRSKANAQEAASKFADAATPLTLSEKAARIGKSEATRFNEDVARGFTTTGGMDTSLTKKEDRLKAFSEMAVEFRAAYTGREVNGVTQTSEMVDAELKRKFEKLFPDMPALDAVKNTEALSNLPAAVSSMQAMGGGGGFYTGSDSMVGLAEQQLSAAERTAAAVERIANGGGSPPASGIVSSN